MSPFYVVYGRLPPTTVEYEGELTSNISAHEFLTQRTRILKELHENLKEAQHRMKQLADKARREVQFEVGDQVLVRLHPYRQISVANHSFSKLRRRFYGPFQVLKKVGLVAYKLNLPTNAKIHSVFHVSKLKRYKENYTLHPQPLPQTMIEGKLIIQPLSILRDRWVLSRDKEQRQVLVRWEGLASEEDTWLTEQDFKAAYPSFNLEDKVVVQGEGNVTEREPFYTRKRATITHHRAERNRDSNGVRKAAGEVIGGPGAAAELNAEKEGEF